MASFVFLGGPLTPAAGTHFDSHYLYFVPGSSSSEKLIARFYYLEKLHVDCVCTEGPLQVCIVIKAVYSELKDDRKL